HAGVGRQRIGEPNPGGAPADVGKYADLGAWRIGVHADITQTLCSRGKGHCGQSAPERACEQPSPDTAKSGFHACPPEQTSMQGWMADGLPAPSPDSRELLPVQRTQSNTLLSNTGEHYYNLIGFLPEIT